MTTTVVHFRDVRQHWNPETREWDSDEYVYIGRMVKRYRLHDSWWCNTYRVGVDGTREECIAHYRKEIMARVYLHHLDLEELRNKTLVCWCKGTGKKGEDVPCHGDILVELLETQ